MLAFSRKEPKLRRAPEAGHYVNAGTVPRLLSATPCSQCGQTFAMHVIALYSLGYDPALLEII
jgi:hypothetical protein